MLSPTLWQKKCRLVHHWPGHPLPWSRRRRHRAASADEAAGAGRWEEAAAAAAAAHTIGRPRRRAPSPDQSEAAALLPAYFPSAAGCHRPHRGPPQAAPAVLAARGPEEEGEFVGQRRPQAQPIFSQGIWKEEHTVSVQSCERQELYIFFYWHFKNFTCVQVRRRWMGRKLSSC